MIAGAVLSGGASRRMGRAKALIDVGGRAMADRSLDALRGAGIADVVLVGGDAEALLGLSADRIDDRYPGAGPLGGVITALHHHADASRVVVVSCDLPMLTADVIRSLVAEEGEIVVARTDRIEPMCAVWSRELLDQLQTEFDGGARAVHQMIAASRPVEVDVDPGLLRNVNTPDDLRQ